MKNRQLIAAFAFIFLASVRFEAVTVRPDKWARYPIRDQAFTAEFPSEPRTDTKKVEGVPGTIYICTSRDEQMNLYVALFMDDLGVNTEKLSAAQLDDLYKGTAAGFKQGVLKTLGNVESTLEVRETGGKEVTFAGLAGKERTYAVGPTKVTIRMAVKGRSMFLGSVTIAFEGADGGLERFFGSFQLATTSEKSPVR
jgi:hypothetical protein